MNFTHDENPQNGQGEQPAPPVPPDGIQTARPVRIAVKIPKTKPVVSFVILGLTIVIFILQNISLQIFNLDLPVAYGAKINEAIMAGQIWRLFTPMLLHASLLHIGFNMYALYALGPQLERYYGHWRFLALYIIAGFAGNLASFYMSTSVSLGASTAIFGLIAAQGIFIYKNRMLYGKNSRSLLINIGSIILLNLALGLSPQIDNWGHLGGLLGGLSIAWFAGPVFKVQQIGEEFELKDQNQTAKILQINLAHFIVISGLALIKIIL